MDGQGSPSLDGLARLAYGTPMNVGFDCLPVELRLKCLANCDWQTLSRAACINRSTRALVGFLVRAPYWRTLSEEKPAVLTTDFATAEERQTACTNWARDVTARLCGRGKPDLCFVFVSSVSHANLPVMLRALRGQLASCTLLAGVVAPGVLGRDTGSGGVKEVDSADKAGLVVSVVHLPAGSTVHAAYIKDGLAPQGMPVSPDPQEFQPPDGELPGGLGVYRRTWLVFSDKHQHVDGVLNELGRRYPGEVLCGGMGGGRDNSASLLVGLPGRSPEQPLHAEVTSGSLVVAISGPGVESVPVSARGMRCISQRFMISQVSRNVELSPVGRVTLVQQLQNSIPLATRHDKVSWVPVGNAFTPTSALVSALQAQGQAVAPRAPLFFGVRMPWASSRDERDPQRMVMLQMHDPNNLMRTSGFVSVQHPVDQGMIAAFFTPQPNLSRAQLASQLRSASQLVLRGEELPPSDEAQAATSRSNSASRGTDASPFECIHTVLNVSPTPVYGCLLFPCVAKGERYYDASAVETGMVSEAFPGASMAGFFCNGEIGPAPPDEMVPHDGQSARMMGYSTVVCALKLTPGPPPPADWAF